MPEQCGCQASESGEAYGKWVVDFCPLHARAAEMRELLAQTPTLLNPEGRRETEWVAKVMALLEETHA